MEFKKFKNVKSGYANDNFGSIEEALSFIKGNRPDLERVAELRSYEKGTSEFVKLKEQMPCIMWNFQSAGRRSIPYATQSTGFLYFDIDFVDKLNLNPLYVFASWKSISETGFGVLVRVEGVNKSNFKICYDDVAAALGLKYDEGTKDITRLNILSLDENLCHNPDSEVFDFTGVELLEETFEEKIDENRQLIDQNSFFKSGEWPDRLPLLRMSNIEEKMTLRHIQYDENGVCDLMEEKLGYTEVYIPRSINEGSRHYQLSAMAIKLVVLNPAASYNQICAYIGGINKRVCTVPKSSEEIDHIVKTVFNKKDLLYLKSNRSKRFFFNNPDLSLSAKRSLVMAYLNKHNAQKRREEICECMKEMDEEGNAYNVTEVMKRCKTSRNTVNSIIKNLQSRKFNLLKRKKSNQTNLK